MRLALALTLLAAPALAECPRPDDMAGNGVRFTSSTGDVETFARYADGTIESTVESETGPTVRAVLAKGVYLTRIFDLVDGTAQNETVYTYPTPLANLPEPFPQGALTMIVEGNDGQGKFKSEESYTFGPASILTIGSCTFAMIPVELSYGQERDIFHYLPEYGLSYLAESIAQDGTRTDYRFETVMGLR
ncbi:MAG: hypothetical protein VX874_14230 [Pseudomonadota bacterium]|nr:hypothetical protein [Pseudomonadota bacterium]